ncbi:MAG: hypothetical protein ABIU09_11435 [Pyrinomonadaceae bacterium]
MIAELFREHRALTIAGAISFACFVIFSAAMLFDSTQVLGINRWIKPVKFFISIAIFLWTVAVYLKHVKGGEKLAAILSWAFILIFTIEMVVIVLQSARGTTSHFNNSTAFDGMMYAIMGLSIAASTILTGIIAFLYFRSEIDLPRSIVWGMRLGLVVFLAGSFEGGYMSTQIGHAVGVADGGAGLPLVNWSTTGGDLRVAHFLGLHAFQAVPLFAYMLERLRVGMSTPLTAGFAFIYFSIFTLVFVQALLGRPLLAGI